MKILAFTDLHEDYEFAEELKKKADKVDLIICAGDITVFGDNIEDAFNFLDSLGKKVLIVHGNHECGETMHKFCHKSKNVIFVHKTYVEIGDLVVFGYGGGGFAEEERGFLSVEHMFAKLIMQKKHSILLTHAPPYMTKLDQMNKDYHVGVKTFRRFIEKTQPSMAISGHIHETFKKIDKIGKTVIVNPGPGGAIIQL
ncbi:MAG: metallophosphoesterase [Candidatus Woesearchaeota archaeon]|jgi:hypothetical protein